MTLEEQIQHYRKQAGLSQEMMAEKIGVSRQALRACNIPCRVHGFTIDKELQKGAMTGIVYKNAPQNVFHSWVEVFLEGTWYELEAFIIDKLYLDKLQQINSDCVGAFCGYGVAVTDFINPTIDFNRI